MGTLPIWEFTPTAAQRMNAGLLADLASLLPFAELQHH